MNDKRININEELFAKIGAKVRLILLEPYFRSQAKLGNDIPAKLVVEYLDFLNEDSQKIIDDYTNQAKDLAEKTYQKYSQQTAYNFHYTTERGKELSLSDMLNEKILNVMDLLLNPHDGAISHLIAQRK